MKKQYLIFVLIILVSLALPAMTACTRPSTTTSGAAETTTEVSTTYGPEMTPEDLTVSIDETAFSMLGEFASLLGILGEPSDLAESPSCLYEGMDKTYTFDDLVVYTITRNSVDLIDGIDLVSDRYTTYRGIRIGVAADDVLDIYGEPYSVSEYDITYLAEIPGGEFTGSLIFLLENETVTGISFYSGSNNSAP